MVHGPAPLSQPGRRLECSIIGLLIWIAWIAYFLLPSDGGLLDGVPLGRLDTIGVCLVVWIAAHRVRPGGATAAAAVAVAAVIATAAVPGDRGLHARYYATAAASGAHERSTDYRDPSFTRVDDRLDFTRGVRDFQLAFFNDHTRFNFTGMGEPDRRYLEFAVAWTGWWWTEAGTHALFLHAPGASSQLSIDATPVLEVDPGSADATQELTLTRGWHRVHMTFSSPYRAPREFAAGELRSGRRVAFDATTTRTERIDGRQQVIAQLLAIGKPIADLIALAWLSSIAAVLVIRRAGELWQRRMAAPQAAFALFLVAGGVESLRFAWPWAERFRMMTAGDDPMTYEAFARDILFNGILMNGGRPPGQGEPFYYQAFYPYFLAATHLVFGEGMFGVLFVQRLLVALTALTLARIAMRLRGDAIWPVGLLVSTLFAWWKFAPIAADLLNESLYIPLLVTWVAALLHLSRAPAPLRGSITGAIGGFAAITRSTAMLSWVLVWPAMVVALAGTRRRAVVMTAVVASSLAVFSLVGTRNWIVTHQFAPTSTELGVTLRGGNEPPPDLAFDPAPRRALYERFGIGGYTVEVIEYAVTAPRLFAANLGRKALFALGFYEPYAPGWGYSPVYIAVWTSALAGLIVALRVAGDGGRAAALIPLLIAMTQYVAVVIVYPKGERLILPIHMMLLPYAAIAAYAVWTRAVRPSR
jgi:hypothetical protein